MKSELSRTVVVVLFVFTLVTIPAAQARPLSGPKLPTFDAPWFQSAVVWLNSFLGLNAPALQPVPAKAGVMGVIIDLPGDNEELSNGSCIDPQGRPRPCPGDM